MLLQNGGWGYPFLTWSDFVSSLAEIFFFCRVRGSQFLWPEVVHISGAASTVVFKLENYYDKINIKD